MTAAAFVFAGFAAVAGLSGQQADGSEQISGSSRVEGRVIAADNGQPVKRAAIALSGLPDSEREAGATRLHVSRQGTTDGNGRFDFTGLPAGTYSITVIPATGFVRPERAWPTKVRGADTNELSIRLHRTGAIEGRIVDERGDPLLGVSVEAVRRETFAGRTRLMVTGRATTNDLGEFRVFDLAPGEYFVAGSRPERPLPSHGIEPPIPRRGYAATYHTGATSLTETRPIVVRGGRTSEIATFTLKPTALASLVVNASDSSGAPLGANAYMALTRRDDAGLMSSSHHTNRRPDGRFRFDGLTPGEYTLIVGSSHALEEGAYLNVTVGQGDLVLDVRTNKGAKVSGRVMVDGQPVAIDPGGGRSASIVAYPPLGTVGVSYAQVPLVSLRETDRFELSGLRGPMVIRADGPGSLVSITRGSEDITGKTLELLGTETLDDVVVSFTAKVGNVHATVTGVSPSVDPRHVLVVLFPEDRSRWHQGHLRYANVTVPAKGEAIDENAISPQVNRVPEGRYRIVAVPDPGVGSSYSLTDTGVLEALWPFATPVAVTAGQTTRMSVGLSVPRR